MAIKIIEYDTSLLLRCIYIAYLIPNLVYVFSYLLIESRTNCLVL